MPKQRLMFECADCGTARDSFEQATACEAVHEHLRLASEAIEQAIQNAIKLRPAATRTEFCLWANLGDQPPCLGLSWVHVEPEVPQPQDDSEKDGKGDDPCQRSA